MRKLATAYFKGAGLADAVRGGLGGSLVGAGLGGLTGVGLDAAAVGTEATAGLSPEELKALLLGAPAAGAAVGGAAGGLIGGGTGLMKRPAVLPV